MGFFSVFDCLDIVPWMLLLTNRVLNTIHDSFSSSALFLFPLDCVEVLLLVAQAY